MSPRAFDFLLLNKIRAASTYVNCRVRVLIAVGRELLQAGDNLRHKACAGVTRCVMAITDATTNDMSANLRFRGILHEECVVFWEVAE